MKKSLSVLIPVIVCLLVGFAGGRMQQLSLETWYPTLVKSPLTPPGFVFPIVWGVLYLLMGVSVGLVIASRSKDKRFLITLFSIQLFVNWLWSILFFRMQNPSAAFIDIIIMDALVVWYIVRSYRDNRISSYLFMPYAAWILFASYLNLYIMLYN